MIILLIILSACNDGNVKNEAKQEKNKVELTVSAAASLQDSLNEIADKYERKHPDVKITFNYGASGGLQQQISQGAPVDLFFSAAKDKFEKLKQDGMISKEIDLLHNNLVLVVPIDDKQSAISFEELPAVKRVAIGFPESVPAGQYAKETLETMKIWKQLNDHDKLVQGKDVRQVLTYVETNSVDAGVVYKTDALVSNKVKIAAVAEERTHSPIVYPVGIIKSSKHQKEANSFYEFLQSENSMKIFGKYGFVRSK
ncbi:molybdate ABC transporter substrate-binding protein [Bacillus massilinigeriensis]|uniref:molybdate ABC transporter substrate-binding protein n=1 Tax=Bacillus mediterraneensis TaxID=1805474 RepID=UPI0008F89842|nr:molybdate ABC transporter substrate-binding protein [Bacillus mediterraneensis]